MTKRHQLQECPQIIMGGWLDHIGCVWRSDKGVAAEEEAIQPQKSTGYNLVITKPNKDDDEVLFR